MSDEDEGLPLTDALRAYSDPKLWAAYEEARRAAAGKRRASYFVVGGEPIVGPETAERIHRDNALVAAHEKAWRRVSRAFRARLVSGELIAQGYKRPITERSERIVIPTPLWPMLVANFQRSRAKGYDLEFVDVRVRRASVDPTPAGCTTDPVERNGDKPGAVEAGEAADLPAPDAGRERRRPGQPSLMPYIKAELERRAEQGQLSEEQADEFRSLEDWAREEQKQGRLPKHRVPKARSIDKVLAKRYQELKAT